MHYMKWIYPRRLRNQMILMAILMVIVPTLTIGYIVETEGRSAVLSEKEKKLSAVVNLLNQALGNRYDLYIDLPREERIRALNAELAPITENITLKWSTKTGHRVRVFSSIDFPIRLVVTHHYIRAVLVRCNIQRYSPLLRELHR